MDGRTDATKYIISLASRVDKKLCKIVSKHSNLWSPMTSSGECVMVYTQNDRKTTLTLEPFPGVQTDPIARKCIAFFSYFLLIMQQGLSNMLRIHGWEVHMSSGVQTDPRKRVTSVILKTVLEF